VKTEFFRVKKPFECYVIYSGLSERRMIRDISPYPNKIHFFRTVLNITARDGSESQRLYSVEFFYDEPEKGEEKKIFLMNFRLVSE
jgi:hypothetical protein